MIEYNPENPPKKIGEIELPIKESNQVELPVMLKLASIQDDEDYIEELGNYLEEGIDYNTNTIKNADEGDLRQLASDSFFAGVKFILSKSKFSA